MRRRGFESCSSLTMALYRCSFATASGVSPMVVVSEASALDCSSSSATHAVPDTQDTCSGVRPKRSWTSMCCRACRSSRCRSVGLSLRQAACSAVVPVRSLWHGEGARDALEGKGPRRRPHRRLDRRLEEVAKAVGGGYCRSQMPLKLALAVAGHSAGRRLGALEGGLPPSLPMHPWRVLGKGARQGCAYPGGGFWHDAMV